MLMNLGCTQVLQVTFSSMTEAQQVFVLTGDLFWGNRPIYPWGGVAFPAALL